jgi:hypothetical protein
MINEPVINWAEIKHESLKSIMNIKGTTRARNAFIGKLSTMTWWILHAFSIGLITLALVFSLLPSPSYLIEIETILFARIFRNCGRVFNLLLVAASLCRLPLSYAQAFAIPLRREEINRELSQIFIRVQQCPSTWQKYLNAHCFKRNSGEDL